LSRLYWEDFTVGRVFEHGPRLLPREEMVAFAAEFDPQPMHLDDEAARHSMLGGLAASGWYGCAIVMRMMFDGFVGRSEAMGAPGVEEVRWLAPIRPGDSVHLRATVRNVRASLTRPDMGLVRIEFELFGAGGERLMVLIAPLMMAKRPAGGAVQP